MSLSDLSQFIDESLREEISKLRAEVPKLHEEMKKVNEDLSSNEAQTDKSENAFYQEAVDRKQQISTRLGTIEERIRRFEDHEKKYRFENHTPSKRIGIGSTIRLMSKIDNKEHVVKLVPIGADNPRKQAISTGSPVGKAVLNREEGEEISCLTSRKTLHYLIKEVY